MMKISKILTDNAKETLSDLQKIPAEKLTKTQFTLYGACVAILGAKMSGSEITLPDNEIKNMTVADVFNDTRIEGSKIDELMVEKLEHFVGLENYQRAYQMSGVKSDLEKSTEELKKMLKLENEIIRFLASSLNAEQTAMLKEGYAKIYNSI